jgi:hypothetical protein
VLPRLQKLLTIKNKLVGKQLNVKGYLARLAVDPLHYVEEKLTALTRMKGFRCHCIWVARLTGRNSLDVRAHFSQTGIWHRYDESVKTRWFHLSRVLTPRMVSKYFREFGGLHARHDRRPEQSTSAIGAVVSDASVCWGYLATYNTDIGLHDPQVVAWVNEGLQGKDLCARLKSYALYRHCFDRFHLFHQDLAKKYGFPTVAVSMEHSANAVHPARVHLHVFVGVDIKGGVGFMGVPRSAPVRKADLRWEGASVPLVKLTTVRRLSPNAIFHAVATGLYYVVGGKSGEMFRESNMWPIKDFIYGFVSNL